ncbi:MAG: phosphomethylpyrimidine kinase [Lachnospiraceae bacterium]|jgi:pyridoxine kinase|nr:phosphomethylpyrimidine kinase [Lachnospiraceae bacterium]
MGGKNILLINDLPGYGKVALAAMVPILSRMGHYPFQIPTAVVSNTLDYGKFRIQEMTDYMRDTFLVWKELGFQIDCVCTGFIVSEEQAEIIEGYLKEQKNAPLVVVDPIMADGGKLYNGIGQNRVLAMKKLAAYADVMVPNITEASFLTGIRPGQEYGTQAELRELADGLRAISGKSVVITSALETKAEEENGAQGENTYLVYGYDHIRQEYFRVPYDYLPVRVAGSGDIFSAMVIGELLAGNPLAKAVQKAVKALSGLILENQGHLKEYKGILVERYWEVLSHSGED